MKLDIEKIIEKHKNKDYSDDPYRPFEHSNVKNAIKQAIKEVLPEILDYAINDYEIIGNNDEFLWQLVGTKQNYTSEQLSEQIIKELGI